VSSTELRFASGEQGWLVEEAMSLGPRTIRPSARKGKIEQRMRDQNLAHLLVTRSDGTLVGVLRRDDL
jgi:Predicted transcriptional regulator containing CBS domains